MSSTAPFLVVGEYHGPACDTLERSLSDSQTVGALDVDLKFVENAGDSIASRIMTPDRARTVGIDDEPLRQVFVLMTGMAAPEGEAGRRLAAECLQLISVTGLHRKAKGALLDMIAGRGGSKVMAAEIKRIATDRLAGLDRLTGDSALLGDLYSAEKAFIIEARDATLRGDWASAMIAVGHARDERMGQNVYAAVRRFVQTHGRLPRAAAFVGDWHAKRLRETFKAIYEHFRPTRTQSRRT